VLLDNVDACTLPAIAVDPSVNVSFVQKFALAIDVGVPNVTKFDDDAVTVAVFGRYK
jgi:hypothetical protein